MRTVGTEWSLHLLQLTQPCICLSKAPSDGCKSNDSISDQCSANLTHAERESQPMSAILEGRKRGICKKRRHRNCILVVGYEWAKSRLVKTVLWSLLSKERNKTYNVSLTRGQAMGLPPFNDFLKPSRTDGPISLNSGHTVHPWSTKGWFGFYGECR